MLDYRDAEQNAADRALCDYAVRLTVAPGDTTESDLDVLRQHGFDDDQITIAVQVIGYFNYINRIADGLGVDPEDWMTPSQDEWLLSKGRNWLPAP